MKLILLLLIPVFSFSQPKGTNTIKVSGVAFKEAANALLDAGYIIEKTDSNLQTIKTEFKISNGKNKQMELSLFVRIKDSIAIITGKTFNSGIVGATFLGTQISKDLATLDIENSGGMVKKIFNEMKEFALSFNKPVEYLKQ